MVFLLVDHRNVSGLVCTVACLNACNLLLGHTTGPSDAIVANPVVRATRVVPITYGGMKAYQPTFIS